MKQTSCDHWKHHPEKCRNCKWKFINHVEKKGNKEKTPPYTFRSFFPKDGIM